MRAQLLWTQSPSTPEPPDERWVSLIGAVVIQAIKDAQSADPLRAVDSVLWLTGDDCPLFLEAAGLTESDPIKLLTSGGVTGAQTAKGPSRWVEQPGPVTEKRCTKCKKVKAVSEFHVNTYGKLSSWCNKCGRFKGKRAAKKARARGGE